ncbi:1879_t:CDS:1, partial [Racocetra fulgida]
NSSNSSAIITSNFTASVTNISNSAAPVTNTSNFAIPIINTSNPITYTTSINPATNISTTSSNPATHIASNSSNSASNSSIPNFNNPTKSTTYSSPVTSTSSSPVTSTSNSPVTSISSNSASVNAATIKQEINFQGILTELITPNNENEMSINSSSEEESNEDKILSLSMLYNKAECSEMRATLANQAEIWSWYRYVKGFDRRVNEILENSRISINKAKSTAYNEILAKNSHLTKD